MKLESITNNIKVLAENRTIILALIPTIIITIFLGIYFFNKNYISTDNAYIKIGIAAISPQVSSTISEVKIKNTDKVHKGDVLLTLDNTPFSTSVELAKANLASSINQIESLKAAYSAKIAQLDKAKADSNYYQKEYDRALKLQITGAGTQASLDKAKQQLDGANFTIKNLTEKINQDKASLDGNVDLEIQKHALYLDAKAKLDKAEFDLNNTIIHAPFEGTIANLVAKEGNFATQGMPLLSIIDYNQIWVEANFKETELTNIRQGQHAIITVDSFPGEKLKAKVIGIAQASGSEFSLLPAQNSSGNWVKVSQRIAVRLEFLEHPKLSLSSGMSATVTINTKSA